MSEYVTDRLLTTLDDALEGRLASDESEDAALAALPEALRAPSGSFHDAVRDAAVGGKLETYLASELAVIERWEAASGGYLEGGAPG